VCCQGAYSLSFFRVEIQLNRDETEQLVVNLQRLLRGETVEQAVIGDWLWNQPATTQAAGQATY
jgi:hypothetical protein